MSALAQRAGAATDRPFTPGLDKGDPYKLYLISNAKVAALYDTSPFGIPVEQVDYCAEWFKFRRDEYEVAKLIALFRRAHAMGFADRGSRVIPRWLLVDLVLMPAGVMLVLAGQDHLVNEARRLERVHEQRGYAASIRDLLRTAYDSDYDGPIPVAAYAALPTPIVGRWVGGSIWWSLIPGKALGYAIRRIALKSYGTTQEVGVVQYDNGRALHVQQKFGRLQVINTRLDMHRLPHSFVYQVDLTKLPASGRAVQPVAPDGRTRTFHLTDAGLRDNLDDIQREIDQGARLFILAGSRKEPGKLTFYSDGPAPQARPASRPVGSVGSPAHFTVGLKEADPFALYVLSNSDVIETLNLSPFGIPVTAIDFRDRDFPFRGANYDVMDLLKRFGEANSQSYEEGGLGIPDWALAELMLMPSAVLLVLADQGYLRTVAAKLMDEPVTNLRHTRIIPLAEDDRDRLHTSLALSELLETAGEQNYLGPLPVAGYAAAPTKRPGYWISWSLWSLVPGRGLGYSVKRLALECYGATSESAVAQIGMARGLDVSTYFGRLRVTNAFVRAHPAPGAFAYEIGVRTLPRDGGRVLAVKHPRWIKELDPEDAGLADRLRRMQHDIDHGARYYVLPRQAVGTKSPLVPVGRVYPAYRRLIAAVSDKLPHKTHPARRHTWPTKEDEPRWG